MARAEEKVSRESGLSQLTSPTLISQLDSALRGVHRKQLASTEME